mgnify:CR=1 FL=1
MILVCAIVPALVLCLAVLYAVLIWRFFTVKAKLPILGVRGVVGRTANRSAGKMVHSAAVLGEQPHVSMIQAAQHREPELSAVVVAADA